MSQETKAASARGGKARAARLSPEERRAAAQVAAITRWEKKPPLAATHSGELHIGDLALPCFVLETGQRVLSQTGVISALGMRKGSNPKLGGDRLANFISGKLIKPFISSQLASTIQSPVRFMLPNGGFLAYGYDAQLLVDICEAVLALRRAGALQGQQEHIAQRCEILLGGFSRVGVVALVDEATGYQADRARDALATILEAYIATELRKWVKTFPTDYYREMFRLRGWRFGPQISNEKPPIVGKLTNSIVYSRLAPGVLDELRRVTPRNEKGRLKHHFHRRLTDEVGHPRLREHLVAVIALMRAFGTWDEFIRALDRSLPKYGHTYELALIERASEASA